MSPPSRTSCEELFPADIVKVNFLIRGRQTGTKRISRCNPSLLCRRGSTKRRGRQHQKRNAHIEKSAASRRMKEHVLKIVEHCKAVAIVFYFRFLRRKDTKNIVCTTLFLYFYIEKAKQSYKSSIPVNKKEIRKR